MNTIFVWLLVSIPIEGASSSAPVPTVNTIAQLPDKEECQRVGKVIRESMSAGLKSNLHCIQAKVVK